MTQREDETCSWCGRYTHRHMDAYYYGFDATGVEEIDRILCSVASAGKGYHHTEHWNEPRNGDAKAGSYISLIQRAANEAAKAMLAARKAPAPESER